MIDIKYVGSKNRLSKYIAPIIQSYIDNMPDCRGYLEPFVGGANMIDKIKCPCKIGNDIHKYLIALLNHVSETTDDFPDTITEEEYNAVRINPSNYPDWYVGFVGFCTFGAKWFGGYPRSFKADGVTPRDIANEAIRNIKKQAPKLKGTIFVCGDFWKLSASNMVIYCDPPYRDTTKYATSDFDYDKFYAWCKEMAKTNIVLVSEYWMPEDGFECIWEGKLKCTLDKSSRIDKTEKLYRCIPCKQ
jgi:site-specific DNA-adenine methylase|nr:MAG TPA: DNA adenine methylase [Caudoviricetes sp.]